MFNGTATLYNTVEEEFKKRLVPHLLTGIHAERTRGAVTAAQGDRNADRLLLIVPFEGFSDASFNVGDLVTIGDTGKAESFAELTARAETFRIVSVQALDFGSLGHWEITCE